MGIQTSKKLGSLPTPAALLVLLTGVAQADEASTGRHVQLHIEDPGKFEVLHSRAGSTNTGAVLFGLIGAGIEESSRQGKDEKREEAILVHIPDDACHNHLVEEFTARLDARGISTEVINEKPGKTAGDAYVIRLRIDACGFRMVDTTDEEMAAYVVAQYRIYKPQEKITGKLEELTLIGRDHRSWESFVADYDAAVEEFRAVKRKTGARLANKIIYLK
jgi:hypothetical protein